MCKIFSVCVCAHFNSKTHNFQGILLMFCGPFCTHTHSNTHNVGKYHWNSQNMYTIWPYFSFLLMVITGVGRGQGYIFVNTIPKSNRDPRQCVCARYCPRRENYSELQEYCGTYKWQDHASSVPFPGKMILLTKPIKHPKSVRSCHV